MQLRMRAPGAWLLLGWICATLAIGCRSTSSGDLPTYVNPAPSEPARDPIADIVNSPLTWQKLERIEEWLGTPASNSNPAQRSELMLQLNEGRVTFAQRDAERANVPQDALRVRLESARDGFRDVLKLADLMPGQTVRSQIGLKQIDVLLDSMKKTPPKPGLVLVDRARWGAATAITAHMTPLRGQWSRITVHHSDETTSDPNGGSLDDSARTLRLIQKYHMEDPNHHWGDIGYHFVIDSAGRIFEGRDLKWQGAHAGGDNNAQNLGICMLGDFSKHSPTPAAMKSLELLIADLRQRFTIPASRLFAHHDFKDTECPGPFLIDWVKKHR